MLASCLLARGHARLSARYWLCTRINTFAQGHAIASMSIRSLSISSSYRPVLKWSDAFVLGSLYSIVHFEGSKDQILGSYPRPYARTFTDRVRLRPWLPTGIAWSKIQFPYLLQSLNKRDLPQCKQKGKKNHYRRGPSNRFSFSTVHFFLSYTMEEKFKILHPYWNLPLSLSAVWTIDLRNWK